MRLYRSLFTIIGIAAMALGVVLIVAPGLYLSLYTDAFGPEMAFPTQRFAPAVVGLGALLLLARDLPAGPFAARFSLLSAMVWFGVAATGLYHFSIGAAQASIVVAAGTEVILGALFVIAARQCTRAASRV